jgi:hypothetical protein
MSLKYVFCDVLTNEAARATFAITRNEVRMSLRARAVPGFGEEGVEEVIHSTYTLPCGLQVRTYNPSTAFFIFE